MRYFLLDKVTEIVPGERARGIKSVTLSDDVLHDHFPDLPVMPGVLVVEAAAQLAGFLLEVSQPAGDGPPMRALLAGIERAKFHKPAQPGDRIEIEARLGASLDAAAQVACEAWIDGDRAMRASLTFVLRSIDSERVHEQRRSLYRVWTRDLDPKPGIR